MSKKVFLNRLVAGLLMFASVILPAKALVWTETAREAADSNQVTPVWFHLRRGPVGESFFLAADVKIRLGSNTDARLADLRVGEIAHISYTIENGRWFAHEIVVNPPRGNHAGKRISGFGANELYAHGAILAYNVATGNLTIKYHR